MKKYQEYEIAYIKENEKNYPKGLLNISRNPSILYYKGNIDIVNCKKNIAIIGTRNASEKGLRLAYETGQSIAEQGLNVVNGLAIGCDAAALRGALSKNGKCIAVMPCGLDQVQPKTNFKLAEEILEKGGCLISEYKAGIGVQKYQYVARDRIQSGISQGIIVIEAEEKSGTMHTVNFSRQQFKRIACYYNKLVELSSGNKLIENMDGVTVFKEDKDRMDYILTIENESEYQQISLFV